jgi:hydroxymethylbilane synthase
MKVRIGTRKSNLALIQTNLVIQELKENFSQIECEIVPISTTGDKITDKNLYDIGGKALFLKEIEEELLEGNIDIAVHSLKDVPGIMSQYLEIAAVLKRDDPRDCFVSFKYKSLSELPLKSIVGSSSVRRKILINQKRPDIKFVQFRGNINTRLQKLKDAEVDATILACAGLNRANLFDPAFCYPIKAEEMLPAAGQGIIAIQVRADNMQMKEICNKINHKPTWYIAQAERSYMTYLDASCRTPMSAYAYYQGEDIKAEYMLSDIEGNNIRFINKLCKPNQVNEVGIEAAKELQYKI